MHITLLHTNDMHANLDAMARLATFLKQTRRELEAEGRTVFYVDAGDAADRRVQFIGITKGVAFPPLLQAMGCDLHTLGNAICVTYGPQATAEMARRSSYPVLAANLFDAGLEDFRPTHTFDLPGGLRLGVVGLAPHMPGFFDYFGVQPADFSESARRWVDHLRGEGVQAVICLNHLGIREDRQLAADVPGIDAIIGGHSHTLLPEGETVNGVLIAQAGEYAAHLGRVDLEIDDASGVVRAKQARLLPVPPDTPPDPDFLAAVRAGEREVEALLAQPVGALVEPFELNYFGECRLANFAADVIRHCMGAEVGLLTSGLFHAGLPGGTVTLGDLNACVFSTANPMLSAVRGEQILAGLERGLDPEFIHSELKAFRGAPLGMPAISGMRVEYDPNAETGARIRRAWVQGEPLDPQRTYRVGHTDAEVIHPSFPAGYLELSKDQMLKIAAPIIVPETLEDYLRAHSPVPAPEMGRWVIVS